MSTTHKRPEKIAIFREAEELLKGREFAFLVNFGGLTVTQISEVRAALAAKDARFVVIKNSILGKVAAENGWEDVSALLSGPTAVVVGGADVADVAKTVVDFVKKNDKASVKGGQMDKKLLSAEEVDKQLKQIMNTIYTMSVESAEKYGLGYNLVAGANIAGFQRVADAMMAQGIF